MKCVICGSKVDRDGSFSNQGENVHCVHCVERLSSRLRCSVSDYLKKYVWPYRNKDVRQLKNLLAIDLTKADKTRDSWCVASVSIPLYEHYKCHSRTRGIPLDTQGYLFGNWRMFENGMEVYTETPVNFSGKSGGMVTVRRYYDDGDSKCLESGRVAVPLDIFRKCFTKIKEG